MTYQAAGRLVPIFSASNNANTPMSDNRLTLSLARAAASRGETVLVIDAQNGQLMHQAGIIYLKTLADVLAGTATLKDAQYVTCNEHFSVMCLGGADWSHCLGSIGAMSLDYDWTFIATPSGCTPVHVNLATACDTALMLFNSENAEFMRAYWMLEAIRYRDPRFDPILIGDGPVDQANETAGLLRETVRSYLGAAPNYLGHINHPSMAHWILQSMRHHTKRAEVA